MRSHSWVWLRSRRCSVERHDIIEKEKAAGDNWLGYLKSINAGEYVYAVGTKNGNCSHIDVVQPPKIYDLSKVDFKLNGDHDISDAIIHKVDNKHWNRRKCWNEELMSPADVEQIITNPQNDHRLEWQQRRQIGSQLFTIIVSIGKSVSPWLREAAHLAVGKPVQDSTFNHRYHTLRLGKIYLIDVVAMRRSGHDVLIKRKWDEHYDGQKIYQSANNAHRFRSTSTALVSHVCH